MKAPDFHYERPTSLDEALDLMADGMASALAGGQSLMPMMNFRLAVPETLVDLNAVAELAGIEAGEDGLRIGAMTRYQDVENATEISEYAPLIARALPYIAHPAIRNRGTLGGSCALADPAAELPALLVALNASITVRSKSGERTIAATDFFRGVYETARADDELVIALHIPKPAPGERIGFHEITRRHGDYAMAGCAVVAAGDLAEVRIALFGVSDRPLRASVSEACLAGSDGGAAALGTAIDGLADLPFESDLNGAEGTKKHLAGVALKRAWAEVMS